MRPKEHHARFNSASKMVPMVLATSGSEPMEVIIVTMMTMATMVVVDSLIIYLLSIDLPKLS